MTRWSPDTCGCVFDVTWDPDEVVAVIQTCPAHAGLPDVDVHESVLRENRTKNYLLGRALQQVAKLGKTLPDGGVTLADEVEYVWEFTGSGRDRALSVRFQGVVLSAAEKGLIRAAMSQPLATEHGWQRQPVTTTVV